MARVDFVPGPAFAEDPAAMARIVDGIHQAGNPYFDHVLGDAARARALIAAWVGRATSELALARVRVLTVDGVAAGGYLPLTGRELRACRSVDALKLFGAETGPARAALLERLQGTKGLFSSPTDDEWYVSKVWLDPDRRGGGLADALIRRAYFEEPGSASVLADVAQDNARALAAYARNGVEVVARRSSPGGLAYAEIRPRGGPRGG